MKTYTKSESQRTKEAIRDTKIKELYISGTNPSDIIESGYNSTHVYKAVKQIPGYPLRKHTSSQFEENPLFKILYDKLANVKARCYNPNKHNYMYYGAKGVEVCEEWMNDWKSFANWCLDNGYVKGMALSRKGDTGNYTPDNCEIKTMSENSKDMIKNNDGGPKKAIIGWKLDDESNKQEFSSVKEAAEYIGGYSPNVSMVVNKVPGHNSTCGWDFTFKD